MDGSKCVAELNYYRQKTNSTLQYEEVSTSGPPHNRTFVIKVVLNSEVFAIGEGKSKKEAKQNAAKNAWDRLRAEGRLVDDMVSSDSPCPSPDLSDAPIGFPNFICWLNYYGQKNKLNIQPRESFKSNSGFPSCSFMVGDQEYPEACGKNKKEAKQEAAKLVYEELYQAAQDGDGASGIQDSLNQSSSGLKVETNYKGLLNQHCQKHKLTHDFKLASTFGPPHNPQFFYKVIINEKEYPTAQGSTAKEAQQKAAFLAWNELQGSSESSSRSPDSFACSTPVTIRASPVDHAVRNLNDSTDDYIIFRDSPSPGVKDAMHNGSDSYNPDDTDDFVLRKANGGYKVIPKAKVRLAANFNNSPIGNIQGKSVTAKSPKDPQPAQSRFQEDYDMISKIGRGGFGCVWKARRKLEEIFFAVKIVRKNEKALREVKSLVRLQHPNIVRYYNCWIEESRYTDFLDSNSDSNSGSTSCEYLYIQMELCDGKNLRVWIDEEATQGRREKGLQIMQQVMEGVSYIHSMNLIHRDLKPENILFGSDKTVKIGDFGLVTFDETDPDEELFQKTRHKGTKSYMSPEQKCTSNYDRKVDIFALGLIYFELLWYFCTHTEKKNNWEDIRRSIFPEEFCQSHSIEHQLIEKMLSDSPATRPSASRIIRELKKLQAVLVQKSGVRLKIISI